VEQYAKQFHQNSCNTNSAHKQTVSRTDEKQYTPTTELSSISKCQSLNA